MWSTRAVITRPSVRSDWLIMPASFAYPVPAADYRKISTKTISEAFRMKNMARASKYVYGDLLRFLAGGTWVCANPGIFKQGNARPKKHAITQVRPTHRKRGRSEPSSLAAALACLFMDPDRPMLSEPARSTCRSDFRAETCVQSNCTLFECTNTQLSPLCKHSAASQQIHQNS